jgi:hypothetical protein
VSLARQGSPWTLINELTDAAASQRVPTPAG